MGLPQGKILKFSVLLSLLIFGMPFLPQAKANDACSQVFLFSPETIFESRSSAIYSLRQVYNSISGKRLSPDQISETSILVHYSIKEIKENSRGQDLSQSIQAIELITRTMSHPDIEGLPQVKNEKAELLKAIVQVENEWGPIKTARIDLFRGSFETPSSTVESAKELPRKGFWGQLLSSFSRSKFSAEQVQAVNPQLSLAQLRYMLKFKDQIFNSFERPPKIEKMSFEQATKMSSGDAVRPLYSFEREMLPLSSIDESPREVLRLYFLGKNQESLVTKPVLGVGGSVEMTSVATFKTLLSQATQQLATVEGVVITHTHPVYNIVMNGTHVQMTPLSSADLNVATQLSRALGGIPLTIRAVVPNGFAFERKFIDGQEVQ